ncbi:MAG: hypothetical protein WKG07_32380 [Hymenobacter sp.]
MFAPERSLWWFVGGYLLASAAYFGRLSPNATFFTYSPLFALGGTLVLWQQQRLSRLEFGAMLLLFVGLTSRQLDWIAAAAGLRNGRGNTGGEDTSIATGLASIDKISYSLYLTHLLVGQMTEFLLIRVIKPTSDLHRTLIISLCLCAALGFAALFYRWVERPFHRWANQLK